jgi:hypothetical protein
MSVSDFAAPLFAALSVAYAAQDVAGLVIAHRAGIDAANLFEVRAMHIDNAPQGQPIPMTVDREIKAPFLADWTVTVRKVTPDGLLQHCAAISPPLDYSPEAVLPADLSLDWWTGWQCPPLTPGQYLATTVWTIKGAADVPVSITSNVFEVTE